MRRAHTDCAHVLLWVIRSLSSHASRVARVSLVGYSLINTEMEKLSGTIAASLTPVATASTALGEQATLLSTAVSAAATELGGVHEVALQAAGIWGDCGK